MLYFARSSARECLTLDFVYCSHVKGRVFAALASGSVAVFSRLAGESSLVFLCVSVIDYSYCYKQICLPNIIKKYLHIRPELICFLAVYCMNHVNWLQPVV